MLLSAREWSIYLWLSILSSMLWWSNSVLLPKESNLLWTTSLPKLISDLFSPFYTFIPYIPEADFTLVSAFPVSFAFCWTAINPVSIFSSRNEKTKTSSSIRWTVSCNVRCSTHSHINGGSVCSSRLELGVPVWTSIHSQGQWKYRLLWYLLADGCTLEVQSLTSLGFRCSVHKCILPVRYNLKFFFCIIFQRYYSPWLQHPHQSLPIGC